MKNLKNWKEKSVVGLVETRTIGDHKIRIYKDRLAISRTDGNRLTWEEIQSVKQNVWGDTIAIEVYPAQCDVVNLRHTRHLWRGELISDAVMCECVHEEFN